MLEYTVRWKGRNFYYVLSVTWPHLLSKCYSQSLVLKAFFFGWKTSFFKPSRVQLHFLFMVFLYCSWVYNVSPLSLQSLPNKTTLIYAYLIWKPQRWGGFYALLSGLLLSSSSGVKLVNLNLVTFFNRWIIVDWWKPRSFAALIVQQLLSFNAQWWRHR